MKDYIFARNIASSERSLHAYSIDVIPVTILLQL